jgi:hypothetical protein
LSLDNPLSHFRSSLSYKRNSAHARQAHVPNILRFTIFISLSAVIIALYAEPLFRPSLSFLPWLSASKFYPQTTRRESSGFISSSLAEQLSREAREARMASRVKFQFRPSQNRGGGNHGWLKVRCSRRPLLPLALGPIVVEHMTLHSDRIDPTYVQLCGLLRPRLCQLWRVACDQ